MNPSLRDEYNELPDWAVFHKDVVWESDNKKWQLQRSGDFNEPIYHMVGNGERIACDLTSFSFSKEERVPKYVKDSLKHIRDTLSTDRVFWHESFGWVLITRFEVHSFFKTYHVYVCIPEHTNKYEHVVTEVKNRLFIDYISYMKEHHPSIDRVELYDECYELIRKVFPESKRLKKRNEERGIVSGYSS